MFEPQGWNLCIGRAEEYMRNSSYGTKMIMESGLPRGTPVISANFVAPLTALKCVVSTAESFLVPALYMQRLLMVDVVM